MNYDLVMITVEQQRSVQSEQLSAALIQVLMVLMTHLIDLFVCVIRCSLYYMNWFIDVFLLLQTDGCHCYVVLLCMFMSVINVCPLDVDNYSSRCCQRTVSETVCVL